MLQPNPKPTPKPIYTADTHKPSPKSALNPIPKSTYAATYPYAYPQAYLYSRYSQAFTQVGPQPNTQVYLYTQDNTQVNPKA